MFQLAPVNPHYFRAIASKVSSYLRIHLEVVVPSTLRFLWPVKTGFYAQNKNTLPKTAFAFNELAHMDLHRADSMAEFSPRLNIFHQKVL
jgi:hypothetical protein